MSYRTDLTERTVRIPFMLAERPHSRQELAQEFNVNAKTISRDIDALTPHYPIVDERNGREVVYRFRDDYKFQSPTFTPAELATLLLAQESIADMGLTAFGSPFAAHAHTMLEKVRASLPLSVRDRLDALAAIYGSAAVPAKDFAPHVATIEKLTAAAIARRRVQIRYHSLTKDTVSERTVEPYAVYFDPDGATLKLVGYDHQRKQIIPFSIDRIRSLRETEQKFTRPPDFNLRHYLAAACFNGIHGDPTDVRLRAHGVTARIFAERIFHRSQRTVASTPRTANRQETITIQMRVASGRGLVRFILSWSPDVEVLSPPALRREVAEAHRQSLALHTDRADKKFSNNT